MEDKRQRVEVGWIITGSLLTISLNWQPICIFLKIYSLFASFSTSTANFLFSSNVLLSVYYCELTLRWPSLYPLYFISIYTGLWQKASWVKVNRKPFLPGELYGICIACLRYFVYWVILAILQCTLSTIT